MKKVLYLGLMTGDNGFTKAFKKKCDYREVPTRHPNFNGESIRVAKEFCPDLIFMQIQAPGIITEETAKELSTISRVINWTGDVRSPIPQWYYAIGHHIDMTCFSNMTDVRKFRESRMKSEFLDIGFDPEIYFPDDREKTKDIVFCGNTYGAKFPLSKLRIQMVEALKGEYGDNFYYYGSGWNNANGVLNQQQEAEAYRDAKVVINLNHFDYERYNSDRMLRIIGCGALALPRYYEGIEVDYPFLVNWTDLDNLKDLIDFYLEDEEARIFKANHCGELSKEHTFDVMIDKILEL